MDEIKRERFVAQNPGERFPEVKALSADEAKTLRVRLAIASGFPPEIHNLALTHHLDSLLQPIEAINARVDFDLNLAFKAAGITPREFVYINWHRYDRVDRIALSDLVRFFPNIWYPSSDDIEIFDDSCSWLLGVDHMGLLGAAILSR